MVIILMRIELEQHYIMVGTIILSLPVKIALVVTVLQDRWTFPGNLGRVVS